MELDWTNIVNIALMVVSMLLAGKWRSVKKEGEKGVAVVAQKANQGIDLANTLIAAIQDDKISPEEEQQIAEKFKALVPSRE